MKKKPHKILKRFLLTAALILTAVPCPAYAQSPSTQGSVMEEVQRLESLKNSDPAAYRMAIARRKQAVRQKLQSYEQEQPEHFREFRQKEIRYKKQRLQEMREKNPERFQQFVERRRERWKRIRENNPEQYERARNRMQSMRRDGQGISDQRQMMNRRTFTEGHNRDRPEMPDRNERIQGPVRPQVQTREMLPERRMPQQEEMDRPGGQRPGGNRGPQRPGPRQQDRPG